MPQLQNMGAHGTSLHQFQSSQISSDTSLFEDMQIPSVPNHNDGMNENALPVENSIPQDLNAFQVENNIPQV